MSEYVKVSAVQSRLKLLEDRNLYMYGVAGCGKTAAVEYFLRRKKHLTIHCHPEMYRDLPPLEELKDDD